VGEEECWWENQKEEDHWEDRNVGWWTILKWIIEIRIGNSGGLL
jgi:hypothetical protein